ncbi:MAG: Crp/Fnr family transcriptional regulator [Clostridiales Family XIII bacterium]|jgi:CRP-like cAMP-binding protein|nr:Crp/Fnr family transcriptional regulator [Clostridiales Family XIII bacterium]
MQDQDGYELNVYKLMRSKLFDGFSMLEVSSVIDDLPHRIESYHNKETIVPQGDLLTKIGIILRGSVTTSKLFDDSSYAARHYKQNDMIGLFIANSKTQISPYLFVARDECDILWFEWDIILCTIMQGEFSPWHKKLFSNIFAIGADDFIREEVKVEVRGQRNVRNKIMRFLMEMADKQKSNTFNLNMSQLEFAEYLCIGRPTLNIELGKLREEGIIDYNKKIYTILK